MKKKTLIISLTAIIILAIIATATLLSVSLLGLRYENGKLYHRDDSFVFVGPGASTCAAISPACGTCINDKGYGIVENKICYVLN